MKRKKKIVELRPALERDRLVDGLRGLKAAELSLDAVLHLVQARAIGLAAEAGAPGVDPVEAKCLARAAGEFNEFYDALLHMEADKLVP